MIMPEPDPFLCPECGSKKSAGRICSSPIRDPKIPWSSVLQTVICGHCRYEIPAHLGELWSDLTAEEAKQEWHEVYRVDAEIVVLRKARFLCPECGSTESGGGRRRLSRRDPDIPWDSVLHIVLCAQCHYIIPAHLGGGWGCTDEEAKREWQETYRAEAVISDEP